MGWLDVVQVQKEAPPEEEEEPAETKVSQKQGVLSIERSLASCRDAHAMKRRFQSDPESDLSTRSACLSVPRLFSLLSSKQKRSSEFLSPLVMLIKLGGGADPGGPGARLAATTTDQVHDSLRHTVAISAVAISDLELLV